MGLYDPNRRYKPDNKQEKGSISKKLQILKSGQDELNHPNFIDIDNHFQLIFKCIQIFEAAALPFFFLNENENYYQMKKGDYSC